MAFPLRVVGVPGRECGECKACCTVLGIHDVSEPWEHCAHECDKGCAIYVDRPQECRDYACLYILGRLEGDERRRPDRLGVLFDFRDLKIGRPSIGAIEIWKDAANSDAVRYLLTRLATKYVIVLKCYNSDNYRAFGPPDWVRQVEGRIQVAQSFPGGVDAFVEHMRGQSKIPGNQA